MFWHRHQNCKYASNPKTRVEFWNKKFKDNIERDIKNLEKLKSLGWESKIIWECETKNIDKLREN